MIERRLVILGALSSGLLSGCSTSGILGLSEVSGSEVVTAGALPSVNALRRDEGKPVLSADYGLGRSALTHAEYMARKGNMSHDGFARRMRRHNVRLPAAENIAEGQRDIASMFEAFVTSPKHRDNMLGNFRHLGVAVAHDGDDRAYWVMQLSG